MKLDASTFLLRINVENDAFDRDTTGELARILRELADRLDNDSGQVFDRFQNVTDYNGNIVGQFAIKPEGYEA